MNRKILPLTKLVSKIKSVRRGGCKVVFTNGCFDILHFGHVSYLRKARQAGDLLVVGLNTDKSVRGLKGPGRPINSQRDRAEVLSELESVDFVTFFGSATPLRLIKALKPDVLVKGADWDVTKIVGYDVVTAYGGRVKTIQFEKGRSTTGIIRKAQKK